MRAWLLGGIVLLSLATSVVAQPVVGPLQAQNSLSEIFRAGSTSQQAARINLGVVTSTGLLVQSARPDRIVVPADYGGNNNAAALAAVSSGNPVSIPSNLSLSGDVTIPIAANFRMRIDPTVVQTGGLVKVDSMVPYAHYPVISGDFEAHTVDPAGQETNAFNYFQLARLLTCSSARPACVPIFGQGMAAGNGAAVWGGNLVGAVAAGGAAGDTRKAIGLEIDVPMLGVGTGTGLLVTTAGTFPANGNAVQIQANTSTAPWVDALLVHAHLGNSPFTNAVMEVDGGSAPYGIQMSSFTATQAEWISSNFIVGASNPANTSQIRPLGDSAGNPSLSAYPTVAGTTTNLNLAANSGGDIVLLNTNRSTDPSARFKGVTGAVFHVVVTPSVSGDIQVGVEGVSGATGNVSMQYRALGTGGHKMYDGAGAMKFQVNTIGIGFNGTAAIAKPVVSGSRAANAALASLLTALANTGLITDSTTN